MRKTIYTIAIITGILPNITLNARCSDSGNEDLKSHNVGIHINRIPESHEKQILESLTETNPNEAKLTFLKMLNSLNKEENCSEEFLIGYIAAFDRISAVYDLNPSEQKDVFLGMIFNIPQAKTTGTLGKRKNMSSDNIVDRDDSGIKRRKTAKSSNEDSCEDGEEALLINEHITKYLTSAASAKSIELDDSCITVINIIGALFPTFTEENSFTISEMSKLVSDHPSKFKFLYRGKKKVITRIDVRVRKVLEIFSEAGMVVIDKSNSSSYLYSIVGYTPLDTEEVSANKQDTERPITSISDSEEGSISKDNFDSRENVDPGCFHSFSLNRQGLDMYLNPIYPSYQ